MFAHPTSLDQALEQRARYGADATVINGGTDIVVAMNHGALRPRQFLDVSGVDTLRQIKRQNGTLILGGGVTFAQMGRCHNRALREASLSVAGPAIRNMGTIGGNLVTASPAGDGSVALLAAGADVQLSSAARGSRWLTVRDFFLDYRKTALADDELVTSVRLPDNPVTRWYKIGKRGAVNISLVCCAVALRPDNSWGIAFGCVGPMPLAAPKAEALLNANELSPELIEQVADTAASETSPIDDFRGTARYRKAMCKALCRRLLLNIAAGDRTGDADAFRG